MAAAKELASDALYVAATDSRHTDSIRHSLAAEVDVQVASAVSGVKHTFFEDGLCAFEMCHAAIKYVSSTCFIIVSFQAQCTCTCTCTPG